MADQNLIAYILVIAALTGLQQSHKIFMMEACNTTIGEIARQKRDELWACIRQVCCQASAVPVSETKVVVTGDTAAVQRWQGRRGYLDLGSSHQARQSWCRFPDDAPTPPV